MNIEEARKVLKSVGISSEFGPADPSIPGAKKNIYTRLEASLSLVLTDRAIEHADLMLEHVLKEYVRYCNRKVRETRKVIASIKNKVSEAHEAHQAHQEQARPGR